MKKLGLRAVAGGLALLLTASVFAPATPANAADVLLISPAPKTLVITADMVDDDGEIVISNEKWDRIIIEKEAAAKDIYFDEVEVGELIVESGNNAQVQLWDVEAEKVTVQEPELDTLKLSDLKGLLADEETRQQALDIYNNVQKNNEKAAKGNAKLVMMEDAKVDTVVVRGNASVDCGEGEVGTVVLEANSSVKKTRVTLKNYEGDVSYAGTDALSVTELTTVNSKVDTLKVADTASNNFLKVYSKDSSVATAEVASAANVSLDVPVDTLEIAATAQVTVVDDVKEMNVSAKDATVVLAASADVEVANIEAEGVQVTGDGELDAAVITAKSAYIATSGTNVDGTNTYTPPVYSTAATETDYAIAGIPSTSGYGYTMAFTDDGAVEVNLVANYSGEIYYTLPQPMEAAYYDSVIIKLKTDGNDVNVKLTEEGAGKDQWGNPVAFVTKTVNGEATVEIPLTFHAGKTITQVRFGSGSNAVTATLYSIEFVPAENGANEVLVPPADGTLCTPNAWEIVAFQDVDFRELAGKTVKITLEAMSLGGDTNPVAHGQFAYGGWKFVHQNKEIGSEWTDFGTAVFDVPADWANSADKIYYGIRTISTTEDYTKSLIYWRNFSVEEVVEELPDDFTLDITGATKCNTDSWQVHHFTDLDLRKHAGKTVTFTVDMAKYGGEETVTVRNQTSTTYQSVGADVVIGNEWQTYTGTYQIPADIASQTSAVNLGFRWAGQNNDYADYTFYFKNFEYTLIVPDAVEITEPDATEVKVGDTLELEATASGTEDITWTSSDEDVATVEDGVVTAKAAGTVTITATYGTAKDEITLTVVDYVTITAPAKDTLIEEETLQLKATASGTVTWSSSDDEIATVSTTGLVTAVSGSAVKVTITAACGDATDSVDLTIVAPEQKFVTIATVADKEMFVGATKQLTATASDEDGVVTWSVDKDTVATVDANGLVTAVAAGTVVVTATYEDATATVTLTVKDYEVAITEPDSTTIKVGESLELEATANADVTWSSSNKDVATVDENGKVTAVAAGTATITATNGTASDTLDLTVIAPIVSFDFEDGLDNVSECGAAIATVEAHKSHKKAVKVVIGAYNNVSVKFPAKLPEGKELTDIQAVKFDYYLISENGYNRAVVQIGSTLGNDGDAYNAFLNPDPADDWYNDTNKANAWATSTLTLDPAKVANVSDVTSGGDIEIGIGIQAAANSDSYYIDNVVLVDTDGKEYLVQDFDGSAEPTVGVINWNAEAILATEEDVMEATGCANLGDKMLQITNANWGQGVSLTFILPSEKTIADYSGLKLNIWLPSETYEGDDQKFTYKDFRVNAGTGDYVGLPEGADYVAWATAGNQGTWVEVTVANWDALATAIGDATTFKVSMGVNTSSTAPYYIDNVTLIEN